MSRPATRAAQPDRDLKLALGAFIAALIARVAYLAIKAPLLTADGSYYYAVARNIAAGRGLTVDYVWHYLAGIPARLPAPSNDYWMPLSSIIQAGALKISGGFALATAAMPSIITGAALAAFVFWLTRELFGSARAGLLAAAMWVLSAHLVALSASTDCFMIAALFTSLGLYAVHRARSGQGTWTLAAGALAALAYLTRGDGAFVAATFVLLWIAANRRGVVLATRRSVSRGQTAPVEWRPLALFAAAFVVIAAPWWLRNWMVFATPLGAPLGKTAFLATYNDIFRLDSSSLNLASYLALNQVVQGLVKAYVLWREVRLLAVICGLALPFAIWAVAKHRQRSLLSPWLVYVALAVGVTAFIFPYPALKGTFWHLAPGVCVFIFAAGASGITDAAQWLWSRGSRPTAAPGPGADVDSDPRGRSRRARAATLLHRGGALSLPALAVAPLLAWYAFTPSQNGVNASPYRRAAGEIRALREPVRVALADDVWSLHRFSELRCAQVPTDGAAAALRVADALGANYLFVQQRTLSSIKGVAAIRRCRRFEPRARWGRGPDAIYAYHIMPFDHAERIAKALNAQGMALAASRRFADAIEAFEAAASYKPDFAPIIANIALASWQAGRREEAYLRAAQALSLDPANSTGQRILQEAKR